MLELNRIIDNINTTLNENYVAKRTHTINLRGYSPNLMYPVILPEVPNNIRNYFEYIYRHYGRDSDVPTDNTGFPRASRPHVGGVDIGLHVFSHGWCQPGKDIKIIYSNQFYNEGEYVSNISHSMLSTVEAFDTRGEQTSHNSNRNCPTHRVFYLRGGLAYDVTLIGATQAPVVYLQRTIISQYREANINAIWSVEPININDPAINFQENTFYK